MNKIEPIIKEIREFIKTTKGKIIVLSSVSIIVLVIIIGVVVGVSYKNSSGGIVPNVKHNWYPFKSPTKSQSPFDPNKPIKPIPTHGLINVNHISIFPKDNCNWSTGYHFSFFASSYSSGVNIFLGDKPQINRNLASTNFPSISNPLRNYGSIIIKPNIIYKNNILFKKIKLWYLASAAGHMNFVGKNTLSDNDMKITNNKINSYITPLKNRLNKNQQIKITAIYFSCTSLISFNSLRRLYVEITSTIQVNINYLNYSIINQ